MGRGGGFAGHVVDAAANATVRSVEHRRRAFQNFNALDVIQRGALLTRRSLDTVAQWRTRAKSTNVDVIIEGLILSDATHGVPKRIVNRDGPKIIKLLEIDDRNTDRQIDDILRRTTANHGLLRVIPLIVLFGHDERRELNDFILINR